MEAARPSRSAYTSVLYALGVVASGVLLTLSLTHRIENSWTEVVAFVTGAWCVWLTVKEHIWNWPIGLANSIFSGIVFYKAALYADTTLQVVYVILGILGWYWWLFGGKDRTELPISRSPLVEVIVLTLVGAAGTYAASLLLTHFNGSAPFLDALTTSMSLVGQYLLTKKRIENWIVWIAVDLIYVPLYVYRGLHLMAILYFVFLVLAVCGLIEWRRRFTKA